MDEFQFGEALVDELNKKIQKAIATAKYQLSDEDRRILNSKEFKMGIGFGKKYLAYVEEYKCKLTQIEDIETFSPATLREAFIAKFADEYNDIYEAVTRLLANMRIDPILECKPEFLATAINDYLEIGNDYDEYLVCLITEAKPPRGVGDGRIRVTNVIDDSQVVLVIDRGIKPETYRAAWDGLRDYLRQDVFLTDETESNSVHSDMHRRMIEDWKCGMTYGGLAEKYHPNDNKLLMKDKIRKLIKRSGAKRYPTQRKKQDLRKSKRT